MELAQFGDGILWGASAVLLLLDQQESFCLTDLSTQVLQNAVLEAPHPGWCLVLLAVLPLVLECPPSVPRTPDL